MRPKRLFVAALALLVTVLAVLLGGAWVLRRNLESAVTGIDFGAALAEVGFEGRVDSLGWRRSVFRWLPRPALVLEDVHARLYSGRPGPGPVSGRIRLEALIFVAGLRPFVVPTIDRVEVRGGRIVYGPDLLPSLRTTPDPEIPVPVSIPWRVIAAVVGDHEPRRSAWTGEGDSAPVRGPPDSASLAPFRGAAPPGRPGGTGPSVFVRDLEVVPLLPDSGAVEGRVRVAAIRAGAEGVEASGRLEIRPRGEPPFVVPLTFRRAAAGGGWDLSAGRAGRGLTVAQSWGPGGAGRWRVTLEDPKGAVLDTVIPGIDLVWSGRWSLDAEGSGSFPRGFARGRAVLDGVRVTASAPGGPEALLSGVVGMLPSRIDFGPMTVAAPGGGSGRFELSWMRTATGSRVRTRASGQFSASWVALLGPGWSGLGSVDCDLEAEGVAEGGTWRVSPVGSTRGRLERLECPLLAGVLEDVSFTVAAREHTVDGRAEGLWGGSGFVLSAERLPLPGTPAGERAAWRLQSPAGRLERFAASPARRGSSLPLPVWMALPGRGRITIDQGSFLDLEIRSLRATTSSRAAPALVDSLVADAAGGTIRIHRTPPGRTDGGYEIAFEHIDLGEVVGALRRGGVWNRGRLVGSASGRASVDAPVGGPVRAHGRFEVGGGTVAGFPLQIALGRWASWTGLEEVRFQGAQAAFRIGGGEVGWRDLVVHADPIRLSGAGVRRLDGRLDAVLRASGEGGGSLVERLLGTLSGGGAGVNLRVEGPEATPSVRLIPASAFGRELNRLEEEVARP